MPNKYGYNTHDVIALNNFLNPPTTGSYITDQKIRADRAAMWANFVRNAGK